MVNIITKYNGRTPPVKVRKKMDKLCNREFYPFDDPIKYESVFYPEFETRLTTISPPPERKKQYNCYAYALGLEEWVHKRVIIEAINNGELIQTRSPSPRDIIIYKNAQGKVQHSGVFTKNYKAISKWAGGPVFKHDIFFVPYSYGDFVEFFISIDKQFASNLLSKYRPLNLQSVK